MISINDLHKTYGKTKALNGIHLEVEQGELFAFLGPNGAGKTTTIRILTGLTKHNKGTVNIGGCDINADPIAVKRLCGIVPQHINLDSELSIYENLDIHGRLFGLSSTTRKQKILELLEYIELADRERDLVKKLSGGLKRRVMIARALLHEPKVLFLDEPTVGLDAAIRRRIWALIKRVQRDGTTVFLTTHYIEEAEFLADRVAFIDVGAIKAIDTPGKLMEQRGAWALDQINGDDMETRYFDSREEAAAFSASRDTGFTLRRVNLEDVFLSITGKKVL